VEPEGEWPVVVVGESRFTRAMLRLVRITPKQYVFRYDGNEDAAFRYWREGRNKGYASPAAVWDGYYLGLADIARLEAWVQAHGGTWDSGWRPQKPK